MCPKRIWRSCFDNLLHLHDITAKKKFLHERVEDVSAVPSQLPAFVYTQSMDNRDARCNNEVTALFIWFQLSDQSDCCERSCVYVTRTEVASHVHNPASKIIGSM